MESLIDTFIGKILAVFCLLFLLCMFLLGLFAIVWGPEVLL